MAYEYDKDEIKNSLTIEQIADLMNDFGAEPKISGPTIISRTVCHNGCGCGSHKLYYYQNTHLYKCYSDCENTFDVFSLVQKVLSKAKPKERENPQWTLSESIEYVAQRFGFKGKQISFQVTTQNTEDDFQLFKKYDRIKAVNITTQELTLEEYDNTFYKHLPQPHIQPWLDQGITQQVMDSRGIKYNPVSSAIVIPHYDKNNRLIGIRERTLIKENEQWGKYRPAYIGGTLFNHPLSYNLYNLNNSKENISKVGTAFVFEGEKSSLLYASFFGTENDLSVAVCGFNLINYQFLLLKNLNVQEIVICFDKQFQDEGDEEFQKLTAKLTDLHNKFGQYVKVSFMFDKWNLLDYKDSPIDKGKEVFLALYEHRINLYNDIKKRRYR